MGNIVEGSSRNKLVASVVVIAAIVLITLGAGKLTKKDPATSPTTGDQPETTQGDSNPAVRTDSNASYKDGTYSKAVDYTSPGGDETVTVKLTVAGGNVANVETSFRADNPESEQHQGDFSANYKSRVVGRPLSSLNLSTVSGASLVTDAFNNALNEIRNQAKV